jgi:hypothetical protein
LARIRHAIDLRRMILVRLARIRHAIDHWARPLLAILPVLAAVALVAAAGLADLVVFAVVARCSQFRLDRIRGRDRPLGSHSRGHEHAGRKYKSSYTLQELHQVLQ